MSASIVSDFNAVAQPWEVSDPHPSTSSTASVKRPLTTQKPLPVLDRIILSHLQRLDLYSRIIERSEHAIGHGAFSEVFKGKCCLESQGYVTVAMKRLRLGVAVGDARGGYSG